jgi:intron-binding protein aquarius
MAPRTRNKEESRREVIDERPTVADLEGESSFATLARKLWLNKKTAKVKVRHDMLKTEIWDVLEKEDFPFRSLLVLENLQILERCGCHLVPFDSANMVNSYLWPGYSEDSSNFQVLLIVLILNVKTREHLLTWGKQLMTSRKSILLTCKRHLHRQPGRILHLISKNTFHDFRHLSECDYPNPLAFFYN